MKRIRNVICVLLCLAMLLGLTAVCLAGDSFGQMGISWSERLSGETMYVSVLLWDPLNLENPDWTEEMFQESKPYIELCDGAGKRLKTVSITGEHTEIEVGKAGTYSLQVYDRYGNSAWNPSEGSYDGLKLTAADWKQKPPADRDGAYEAGYVFFGRTETSGTKTTITLEPMRETDKLEDLVKKYQPMATVAYYDEGLEIYISGDEVSLSKPLTVDLAEHDGYWIMTSLNDEEHYIQLGSGNSFDNSLFLGKEPADEPYDDVKEGDWYYDTVCEMHYSELMKGVGSREFAPKATMTYAEAVTLAARLYALGMGETIPAASGPWYQRYVNYAKQVGIPCDYDMKAKATRENFAHIFFSVQLPEDYNLINEIDDGAIPDVSMEDTYAEEIYTLYRAGILTGDKSGSFHPESTITRAEVATIACRMAYQDYYCVQFSLG